MDDIGPDLLSKHSPRYPEAKAPSETPAWYRNLGHPATHGLLDEIVATREITEPQRADPTKDEGEQ